MVFILDNTLMNLIATIKAINIELTIDRGFDDSLKTNYEKGGYVNNNYTILLKNNFTIMCGILVSEVKYGHKFERRVIVNNITVLDEGGFINITETQRAVLNQTLHKLVTIKNSIQ